MNKLEKEYLKTIKNNKKYCKKCLFVRQHEYTNLYSCSIYNTKIPAYYTCSKFKKR